MRVDISMLEKGGNLHSVHDYDYYIQDSNTLFLVILITTFVFLIGLLIN